jgi:chromosome segregation protein
MLLKSLEINGFKSFAKKGELDFNTPITSIVGPNGSGKSNVAESFRFVLGEQSMKSLRGKRGEDLIFNGSNETSRMNRASVKITFDNTSRFLDIDFDEVTIERIVHRDGTNEYKINGSTVRLKDVTELLSKANIGSTGHHIISQGEADRILSANPKDRKAMIEDALGLRVYQFKILESERKLQKTGENIREVGLLRKEIAPHLKFLKKQVEKIEKAEELRKELELLYQDYLKREHVYLENEKTQIETGRKGPEEKLAQLDVELKEATSLLEQGKEKDEKTEELVSLEKEIASLYSKKDEITRELGQVEGELRGQEKLFERQEEQFSGVQPIPYSEVEKFRGEFEEDIERVLNESNFAVVRSVLERLKNSFKEFLSRYKNEQEGTLLADIKKDIANLTSQKEALGKDLAHITEEMAGLNSRYDMLQKEIEKEKDSERGAETAVFRIRAERNEILSILNTLENREQLYVRAKGDFDEELREGGVLIGQKITDFKNYVLQSETDVLTEDRGVQEDGRKKIERIKIRLEDMGGGSADEVLREYKDVAEREEHLLRELTDLEQTASALDQLIKDLKEQLDQNFRDGIKKINIEFKNFFSLMFGGGDASLRVVEAQKRRRSDLEMLSDEEMMQTENEEAEEGIDISVSLPRKKVKGLVMLSGGERALTSIALLFAMSQVTPPPFIILDETDAALDEANSRKYGDMIENLSKHSQLILITHNRETMSRAGVLYGVTMGSGGVSKLLSVAFDEAVEVAK